MMRYLSVQQLVNAAWLLMLTAALVLGEKTSLIRPAMSATTAQIKLRKLAVLGNI